MHAYRIEFALAVVLALAACGDGEGPSDAPARRGARIDWLEPVPIGDPPDPASAPWISNVTVVDLDQDGLVDVVACEAKANRVSWIRQEPAGSFVERDLGAVVLAPAHAAAADVDGDGDLDLLVAEMGKIDPTNERIGAVHVLENDGAGGFVQHVLVDGVARVTDVEAGDLDGDGDVDLAVGQFGYYDGEIRWMENRGGWRFESHALLDLSGTIHTPVADMDGDGDLDIVAVVSQEWEEIYVFENDGAGSFEGHVVYASANEDFGSSGIALADLDGDGDEDVLYTNGDAFDYTPPAPRPWHGVQWLENLGGLDFAYHRIGDLPGAFSPRAADVDGDGDMDVVAVSMFNRWDDPQAVSMRWFENDGTMTFLARDIATSPTHLVTLDAGDVDGDGRIDFVTGGMYAYPPFDRMSRVTLWKNVWPGRGER